MKKILITGTAGFIGMHLVKRLVNTEFEITGIDNINDYYDVELKYARLKECGISKENIKAHKLIDSDIFPNYKFIKADLNDADILLDLFKTQDFDIVCNLAAQAGVRYSITNPQSYIKSNIDGFLNILECCKQFKIKHLVYASSSSVYGLSDSMPLKIDMPANSPVSLYAATKKMNELMAYTYTHLFKLPTTGLRFFTVYGPWGRPDMAPFIFANEIYKQGTINIFNNGEMMRDFTYIDDIVEGVHNVINSPAKKYYNIYNIGASSPIQLMNFIQLMESEFGTSVNKIFKPMQLGDVKQTYADMKPMQSDYGYNPQITLEEGIKRFINWYKEYHK
jgi:UDP-glucuronate 4-epimerase